MFGVDYSMRKRVEWLIERGQINKAVEKDGEHVYILKVAPKISAKQLTEC